MSRHHRCAESTYCAFAVTPSGSLISYATPKKLGYFCCASNSHCPPLVGNGDGEHASGCGVGSFPGDPPGISNRICASGKVCASALSRQSACDELSQSFITSRHSEVSSPGAAGSVGLTPLQSGI